ncbi:MAG TPA: type II toxin-antitoxin system VapC family toxin [Galbitalea sp.]|jgi:hypothetical protein|nr:type II toxin-antitoxin system VapC family toxin [Galbitalea sp.]
MVAGEVALGSIRNRRELLELLSNLPTTDLELPEEVLVMFECRRLHGRGLSLIDAHLLASTVITSGMTLWTRDNKLSAAAKELGVSYTAD